MAEVRPEPEVRREAHVVRRRDDDVGHDPALQTAHPVRQHDLRNSTHGGEALGQQRQGGIGALVVGEADEAHPRPRQHRAEHVQPVQPQIRS